MALTEPEAGAPVPVVDVSPPVRRVGTRALLVLVGVLLVALVAGLIGSLVMLHQPPLTPVPVPSASQL